MPRGACFGIGRVEKMAEKWETVGGGKSRNGKASRSSTGKEGVNLERIISGKVGITGVV